MSDLYGIQEEVGNVNAEFNQYMEYYMQLLRLDSKGKVLIVEDDFISAKTLEKAVHEFSPYIKCLSSTSAEEATKILSRTHIDAVIADYFLEGQQTGLELCNNIQLAFPQTKCLIVSNLKFFQYQEIVQHAKTPPDFIEKPVPAKSIKNYLESIYGGSHEN